MVNRLNTDTQNIIQPKVNYTHGNVLDPRGGGTTRLTVYGRVGHHGDRVVVGEGGQLAEVGGREGRRGEGGRGGGEGGEGGGGGGEG